MNYRVIKTYTQPNVGQIGVGSVSLVEYADGTRRWVEHNAVNLPGQAELAYRVMAGTSSTSEDSGKSTTPLIAAGALAAAYFFFRS